MTSPIDKDRLMHDQAYRAGVFDCAAHNMAVDEEIAREKIRRGIENRDRVERERQIGWSTPEWACYFWFVGWDCISIGFHVCLSAPNIEIHVPFGFIKFGRHTNVQARRDIAAMSLPEKPDA